MEKKKMSFETWLVFSLFLSNVLVGYAFQCGAQADDALCPPGICCSIWGWCGTTADYCKKEKCQSQCREDADDDDTGGSGLEVLLSKDMFEEMLPHRNDPACPASGFYTYVSFINASKSFPKFALEGDEFTRLRELAAFFGQTSHATTGAGCGRNAPDSPYKWGYCFNREVYPLRDYCDKFYVGYPCVRGQSYFGRGPIQLSWNYNYGKFGDYLEIDLVKNPDLVATDARISFESALWFWMTPQPGKPSPHDVIVGNWKPNAIDRAAGREPGYGLITNIINGAHECGRGKNDAGESRIQFYRRYSDMLRVYDHDNLDCYNQKPFPSFPFVSEA